MGEDYQTDIRKVITKIDIEKKSYSIDVDNTATF